MKAYDFRLRHFDGEQSIIEHPEFRWYDLIKVKVKVESFSYYSSAPFDS